MNVPLNTNLQLIKNNKKQTSIMETGRDSMFTQPPLAETNSKIVSDKKALKKSNSCEYKPENKNVGGKQTSFENIDIAKLT